MTPFFVATLAFLWTIAHLPSEIWPFPQLFWSGVLFTLAGLAGHILWKAQSSWCPAWLSAPLDSRVRGTGVRDDDRLSVYHDRRAARLYGILVGWFPWRDRASG